MYVFKTGIFIGYLCPYIALQRETVRGMKKAMSDQGVGWIAHLFFNFI